MVILRNFLFLDNKMLDDYLATLEGYTAEGSISQTEFKKSGKSGKGGYKFIEGGLSSEKGTETKKTLAVTEAAKFQRFYENIEESNGFTFLDLFDDELWGNLQRGELVEVEVTIRLPEPYQLTQLIEGISPFLDIMTALGEDPLSDPKSKAAFDGMRGFSKLVENKPIPLICDSVGTPGYKFLSNLPQKYLQCTLDELQGETTLFGKIQRRIPKSQKYEVFSLVSAFTLSLPNMSRSQQKEMQKDMVDKGIAEVIEGPAMIVIPLAIYR
jgi:hypothetical protein